MLRAQLDYARALDFEGATLDELSEVTATLGEIRDIAVRGPRQRAPTHGEHGERYNRRATSSPPAGRRRRRGAPSSLLPLSALAAPRTPGTIPTERHARDA